MTLYSTCIGLNSAMLHFYNQGCLIVNLSMREVLLWVVSIDGLHARLGKL